jgi:hypothetical protein
LGRPAYLIAVGIASPSPVSESRMKFGISNQLCVVVAPGNLTMPAGPFLYVVSRSGLRRIDLAY